MGAQMVKEVASQTSEVAGDGTTTATVLAQAIYREGAKNVTAGANPMAIKRGIEKSVEAITAALKTLSKPVTGPMIAQVGTIAANHDEAIGRIIAEAMDKVGKDGVITVEEGKTLETSLEIVEGMQFDRGYLSPYFITDPERMEVVLENPVILIHEKKISALKGLLPVLEHVAKAGTPLLIVAEDIDGEALATIVVNKLRGTIAVGGGEGAWLRRSPQELLEDIAVLTGGQVGDGRHRDQAGVTDAGRSRAGEEGDDRQGSHDHHQGGGKRRRSRAASSSCARRSRSRRRTTTARSCRSGWPSSSGGIAVIKIGAATESEMKEKKARVEDAMHATKAAVAEGIVPGGGLALLRASTVLHMLTLDDEEQVGVKIVVAGHRGADAVDRHQRRSRRLDRRPARERAERRRGLQRSDGTLREPGKRRRHRPHEGRPNGAAERGLSRIAAADDRSGDFQNRIGSAHHRSGDHQRYRAGRSLRQGFEPSRDAPARRAMPWNP